MPRVTLGILPGLAAGVLDVLLMLPMSAILTGGLVGLLVSLPDAVSTKVYAPIIITGIVFGVLAAWAARTWAV